MTKVVNRINCIKEGNAIIVSIMDEGRAVDIVLAREDNKIKAYDVDKQDK